MHEGYFHVPLSSSSVLRFMLCLSVPRPYSVSMVSMMEHVFGLCDAVIRADRLFVHICVPGHNAGVHSVVYLCIFKLQAHRDGAHADDVDYVSICHDAFVCTSPVNQMPSLMICQGHREAGFHFAFSSRVCAQFPVVEIRGIVTAYVSWTTGPFEEQAALVF